MQYHYQYFSAHVRHVLLRICERRVFSSYRYSLHPFYCKRLLIATTFRTMSTNSTQSVPNDAGKPPRYIDVNRPFLLPKIAIANQAFPHSRLVSTSPTLSIAVSTMAPKDILTTWPTFFLVHEKQDVKN
jgi:hypothetical protein